MQDYPPKQALTCHHLYPPTGGADGGYRGVLKIEDIDVLSDLSAEPNLPILRKML